MTSKAQDSGEQHTDAEAPENGLSYGARKAHEFEKAYRAHPSVYSDNFYRAPPDSASAPAGTLLNVERETDPSLYNLPPNNALSPFMY